MTWADAKPLIERIIGKPDQAAKKRSLKRKLSHMSRHVALKEPFWQFLSRLTKVASQIWTSSDAVAEAVEQIWLDNLRPMDQAHLVHMGEPSDNTLMTLLEAQADYLDRGKMYKRDTKSIAHSASI